MLIARQAPATNQESAHGISGNDAVRGLDIRMDQVLKYFSLGGARLRKHLGNGHDWAVVLQHLDDESVTKRVRSEVEALTEKFPLYENRRAALASN